MTSEPSPAVVPAADLSNSAKILKFPSKRGGGHARTSSVTGDAGQRSGRSSPRETPVAVSIANTYSAGTPFLERVSQYQTCDCVVPIRSAKGFCPPATSQARLSDSVRDMSFEYPNLGEYQPKSLSRTSNLIISTFRPMRTVDKNGFAARLVARRKKVGISQAKLANAVGMKQQGIQNLEKGVVARPRGIEEIAEALLTTKNWLLWEEGPEEIEPVNPIQQITGLAQKLDPLHLGAAIRYLKTLSEKDEAVA